MLINQSKTSKTSFLCCDQNYDLLKTHLHRKTCDFLMYMSDEGFVPYIHKPTRVTHASATLIDNIYVKISEKLIKRNCSFVVTDGMSDHYPCLLSLELREQKKKQINIYLEKQKITNDAMLQIQQYLLFYDWSFLHECGVDEGFSYLDKTIQGALDQYAPKRMVKICSDDKFHEPWLTVSMMKCNKKSRKLCNKARQTGSDADHSKYKNYRNALNKIKMYEKKMHYKALFDKIGKNSKLLWNVINGLLRKSHDKSGITRILCNNEIIEDKGKICETFNRHFVEAGKRVQNTIIKDTNGRKAVDPCTYVQRVDQNMSFKRISEGEICKIVLNLKLKTSSGIDGVSNMLLKKLVNVIKGPLCFLCNMSLQSGIFPRIFKTAKVVPLHKGNDIEILDNYRPISLLPVISKILERIVYNFMVEHLEKNQVLFPKQFGFRRRHSTSDAALSLVWDILEAFDKNLMVLGIFIDLRKAFDTVSHTLILRKLSLLGINGSELDWLTSYLSLRKQHVEIENFCLENIDVDVGIPQGSLLRVLLFQLHINDLPKSLRYCSSILYADDTTIYLIGNSLRFMKLKVQHDLNQLSAWLRLNCLKLNVKKTKLLLFNREGLKLYIDLEVDGESIEMVFELKFLGITLDAELSFGPQFRILYDKLLKSCFVIKHLSRILPSFCVRSLYYAYFYSHLTYCLPVWYPLLNQSSQNSLHVLHKRLIRAVSGAAYRQHCMPLFKKQKILMLRDQLTLDN